MCFKQRHDVILSPKNHFGYNVKIDCRQQAREQERGSRSSPGGRAGRLGQAGGLEGSAHRAPGLHTRLGVGRRAAAEVGSYLVYAPV